MAKSKATSILEADKNKLPMHLCHAPKRQNMSAAQYEDSFREMLANRVYLQNEEERAAFGNVVRQGIPPSLRAEFWNLCTGIHMYRKGYCAGYYEALHEALRSGELTHYPNQMFEKYKRDISRAFPND